MRDVPGGRQRDGDGEDHQKSGNLAFLDQGPATMGGGKARPPDQRQSSGDHEHDRDQFDRHRIVETERRIFRGVATGRQSRHRMVDGIERVHPGEPIADGAGGRQPGIGSDRKAKNLIEPGRHLVRDVGGFGTEELHAADAEDGQDEDRHKDNACSAKPLEHRAPQQETMRKVIEADEHRRAGSGETRHSLEECVGDGGGKRREDERQ